MTQPKALVFRLHVDKVRDFLNNVRKDGEPLSKTNYQNQLDGHVWFLANLLEAKSQAKVGESSLRQWTNMDSRIIRRYLGNHDVAIRDNLIKLGIIGHNKSFKVGRNSMSYRFLDTPPGKDLIVYDYQSKTLIKKLLKAAKDLESSLADPVLNLYHERLRGYGISGDAFDGLIRFSQGLQEGDDVMYLVKSFLPVERIRRGNISLTQDDFGRIYNPFVGLKKAYRRHIFDVATGEMMNLVEVDISACYAFIFSSHLRKQCKTDDCPRDLRRFHAMTTGGAFYRDLFKYLNDLEEVDLSDDELREEGFDRPTFKDSINAIFNRRPKENNREAFIDHQLYKDLKKAFPTVYDYLEGINGPDHHTAHWMVTKHESDAMVDDVLRQIVEHEIPAILVHDGVLVKPNYADLVKGMIQEAFAGRLGYKPFVRVKGDSVNCSTGSTEGSLVP